MIGDRKLAIVGISGRMGKELQALAKEFNLQVTQGVSSRAKNEDGIKIVAAVAELDAANVDVVIDFSLPELTLGVAKWCQENRKPLVSGVTGIQEQHRLALQAVGKFAPVLWAPNMSLGVAVMARMMAQLASLDGFDFQIEELHHNKKKDSPSGTAVFLQEKLKAVVGENVPDPIGIRGGGIFGIHKVWAMGEEETITLEHTAINRRVFARGALKAAHWILTQSPALYRMDDVLG